MRTIEEYTAILALVEAGNNFSEISKQLNIPRTTIRDLVKNKTLNIERINITNETILLNLKNNLSTDYDLLKQNYSYLLGMFLGDGCLSPGPKNVYHLRITLDAKYPNIILKTKECVAFIMQSNKVSLVNRLYNGNQSCVDVSCYSKDFVKFFPFYKPGPKWKYKIELENWQKLIVEQYPKDFWLGLFHSDGSRYKPTNGNNYYYTFTQKSEDITNLFARCSDLLKLKYGISRNAIANKIQIYNKETIIFLDTFAGPKT